MNEDEVRSRMPLTGNQMFTAGGELRNRFRRNVNIGERLRRANGEQKRTRRGQ
jgi:hypothetical protein